MQTTTFTRTWEASSPETAPRKGAQGARCEVETVASPDALLGHARDIEQLAARALVPNILVETSFLHAAWTRFFGSDPDAQVILVRDAEAGGRLVGLLPVTVDRSLWGGMPLGTAFRNDMKFCGAPLVDRDRSGPAVDAMLSVLAALLPFPSAFLFDEVPAEGPMARALKGAFARFGWQAREYGHYERVVLDASRPGDEYLAEAISGKKRKEYRRLSNRLKDMGALEFALTDGEQDFATALEDFFRLEKQGWKGENGTAILDSDVWSGYFRDATAMAVRAGQASMARLVLDGRTIAAGLVMTSGTAAWFYKIAYDETLSHFSPGVLLTLELTKFFCDRPGILTVDSCAHGDHPMIAHLWRERETYCDMLAVPPDSPSRLIFCAESIRRDTRELVKKGYHSLKRKMRG